jgi:ADP-ribose pyrophosphatase YjhB (NUDIX family)
MRQVRRKPDGAHVVLHRKLKTGGGRHAIAILLTKRTLDAPSDPGDWGLVGGAVDRGERPRRAVMRELREEISFRGRVLVGFLCKKKKRTHTVHFYRAHLPEDMDTLRLRRNKEKEKKVEADGLAWFTRAEVRSLRLRPQDRFAVNRFFSTFS